MGERKSATSGRAGARGRRPGSAGRCPICGAPSRTATRPFCSRRCAEVDLGRWLRGTYRIPTEEPPAEEDGASGDEP